MLKSSFLGALVKFKIQIAEIAVEAKLWLVVYQYILKIFSILYSSHTPSFVVVVSNLRSKDVVTMLISGYFLQCTILPLYLQTLTLKSFNKPARALL